MAHSAKVSSTHGLRVEYDGGIYYVMNRGDGGEPIFSTMLVECDSWRRLQGLHCPTAVLCVNDELGVDSTTVGKGHSR